MKPTRVTRNVGMNPVAQAVARAKLHSAITTQKIRVYLMEQGEPCMELVIGLGETLAVIGLAAELEGRKSSHEYRVLMGGLSACRQLSASGKYDTLQTVSIAAALDKAEELHRLIAPHITNTAINIIRSHT